MRGPGPKGCLGLGCRWLCWQAVAMTWANPASLQPSCPITWLAPRPSPGFLASEGRAEGRVERSPRLGLLHSSWSNPPPSWKFPREGDKEGSLSDSSQRPPVSREQGQCREAGGDLAGRLCFQSWLSRAGAGEHTVPIRSPVLCCVCFHGLGERSGDGRFLSILQQPASNQG